jgi:hypothetical protein
MERYRQLIEGDANVLTKKFLFSYEQPGSFGSAKAASKQAG